MMAGLYVVCCVILGLVAAGFVVMLAVFFGCATWDAVSWLRGVRYRAVVRAAERELVRAAHPSERRIS